ncbi:Hypothetical predicted protein [Olea europaea subsp. europaea]|uniref:J domain-containing protein n=1 Tax=Olea europaea subsp. europaea TaxID=158383 RepID=A0A8S0RIG0_OLEEU|nr:Hypothetical predicted protein [Olea europaea subsp. europaea]
MGGSKKKGPSAPVVRRDPYEMLCVSRDSSDQEIKSAYRKLALKYHPDKNACNPEASELFKEVACSYSILSDPEKRRQYDSAGFQALDVEGMDMEIDLSSLGTVNTMLVALFSKLGVPIKTTISTNVLKEALSGTVRVRPLPVGTSVSGKVEKQSAHFFGVIINEDQAEAGIVVRVTSSVQSKFKLLYFEQEANEGYGQVLQVDELLKRRDNIHSSFTVARSVPYVSGSKPFGNGSSSISRGEDLKSKSLVEEGRSHSKGKSTKKKWFSLNLK